MADIHTIEGDFTPGEGRFALIVSRFNAFVVESLVAGALDALRRHGVSCGSDLVFAGEVATRQRA